MKQINLFLALSMGVLATTSLNAQTFQPENGDYRIIGEMSNQFQGGNFSPWDSAIYIYDASNHELKTKYYFTYDVATTSWDTSQRLDITVSSTSTYKQHTSRYFAKVGGVWNTASEYITRTNLNGGTTLEQTNTYDASSSSYVNSNKSEYDYDANNRFIKRTFSNWDAANSVWNVSFTQKTTYLGNTNNKDSVINYDANGAPTSLNVFTYNGQNLELTSTIYSYDAATSTYKISSKVENTYTGSDLTLAERHIFDVATNALYMYSTSSYTFSNAAVLTELTKSRNNPSATLNDNKRVTNTYDSDLNPTTSLRENYNVANSTWSNGTRANYDFNDGHYKTYELHELWIIADADFRDNLDRTYYYENNPTPDPNSINGNLQGLKFDLAPNPAVSHINIQLEKAEKVLFYVYSFDGKLVQSGTCTEINNQLNVNELSAGLYIIQLAGENVKGSTKFVKM